MNDGFSDRYFVEELLLPEEYFDPILDHSIKRSTTLRKTCGV
jgi:hypothetical protein